jgi:protein tyrosine phosphatase (PTP) superfamily phosphohydrolase (DUF442 family)
MLGFKINDPTLSFAMRKVGCFQIKFIPICLLLLCNFVTAAEIGLLELPNYYEYSPSLVSSGQPARDQFKNIAEAGVDHVINLAPKHSPDAILNEREIVEALGMGYSHIPIDWDDPTVSDLKKYFSVITANPDKTILVHCWLNARASAFVYLSRVLAGDRDEESEYAVLEEIWSANPGYELENVHHWRDFLLRAVSELKE